MAPRAGFEPATNALTAHCSTAELPRNATQKLSEIFQRTLLQGLSTHWVFCRQMPSMSLAGCVPYTYPTLTLPLSYTGAYDTIHIQSQKNYATRL